MTGAQATSPHDAAPAGVHVVAGPPSVTGPVVDQLLARAGTPAVRFDLDDAADHSRFIAEIPAVSLFGGARVLVAHAHDVSDVLRDTLRHLPAADLAVLVLPRAPKPALTGPASSPVVVHTVDAEKVREANITRWLATYPHHLSATSRRLLRTLGDPADSTGLLRALSVLSQVRPVADDDLAHLSAHLTHTSNSGPWRAWELLFDGRLAESLAEAQEQAPLAVWSYISQTLGRALLLVDMQDHNGPRAGDAQVLGCTANQAASARRVADRVEADAWPRLMRLCVDVDERLKVDPDPDAQLAAALTSLHTSVHPPAAARGRH